MDLGNYERFLNVTLSRDNNITTGKIYQQVIEREVKRKVTSYLQFWLEEGGLFGKDRAGSPSHY